LLAAAAKDNNSSNSSNDSNSSIVLFGLHSTKLATTPWWNWNLIICCILALIVGFKTCCIKHTHYKKNQHEIEEEPDAVWLLIALNWIPVYNTKKEKKEKRKRRSSRKKRHKKA
jgi:hypothetical protein